MESLPMAVRKELLERELRNLRTRRAEAHAGSLQPQQQQHQPQAQSHGSHPQADGDTESHGD
jgi:hypothetical protein